MLDVLKLLAAKADRQIAALPEFVVAADELALLFTDQLAVARSTAHQVPAHIWGAVENIAAMLEEMSKEARLWTDEALAREPEWERVRAEAGRVLAELREPDALPPLTWLHYVPGAVERR